MMIGYRNTKKVLKVIFAIVIFIQVVSSCISVQNITLDTYKNTRIKKVEELKNYGYSFHKGEETVIDPGSGDREFSAIEIFDNTTFLFFLVIIKNLLTLFSKLIVILSFFQFFLYIRGWIILVSQVKFRFFVMRYLQLMDGKKNQLVFQ
jgi:hypothetical protein